MTLEQLLVQTQLLSPMQLAVAQRDAQMPVIDPLPDDAVSTLQRRLPRVEAQLTALTAQIDRLQKRIDAIDEVLHRVVRQ